MKRIMIFLLAGSLYLGLSGCGAARSPKKAADGLDWDESWVTVGGVIGVDTPEGMDSRENNEALAANGMYYATWSMGNEEPFTNSDGEEARVYDVQVYFLLARHKSAEEAGDTLAQWKNMTGQRYVMGETAQETHNGQDFTVITYSFSSDSNPYARGSSAFGTFQNYAISVELACRENYSGDAAQLLGRFLDSCHYAVS